MPTLIRASVQQINLIGGGGFRRTPFNLTLRGPDLNRLDQYSAGVIRQLKTKTGFVDLDTAQSLRHPEIQVHIDRQKASDLGVRGRDRGRAPHHGRRREDGVLRFSRSREPPRATSNPRGLDWAIPRPISTAPYGSSQRAQVNGDGGVSYGYSLADAWRPSHPETSGFISATIASGLGRRLAR